MTGVTEPPCAWLRFHDGRFWCGLVEMEQAAGMELLVAQALGVGRGCDASSPTLTAIRRSRGGAECTLDRRTRNVQLPLAAELA